MSEKMIVYFSQKQNQEFSTPDLLKVFILSPVTGDSLRPVPGLVLPAGTQVSSRPKRLSLPTPRHRV